MATHQPQAPAKELQSMHPLFASLVGGEVVPIPREMTMEKPMEHERGFYVRACYAKCYRTVQERLSKYDSDRCVAITVTGTPGVGMSVFGAYYYLRFRQEHPNAWIVLASLDKKSMVTRVVVVKDGHVSQPVCGYQAANRLIDNMMNAAAQSSQKLFRFFDGTPDHVGGYGHLVCFTRPDDMWVRCTRKSSLLSMRVCLPLWSLDELQAAATALGLTDIQDLVRDRYNLFGGVAGRVLRLCRARAARNEAKLLACVASFTTMPHMWTLLSEDPVVIAAYHELLHMGPHRDSTWEVRPTLASPQVQSLLMKQILTRVSRERDVFHWLSRNHQSSSLNGWLFEMAVHEKLVRGCDLQCRRLTSTSSSTASTTAVKATTTFTIQPSERFCFFDELSFSMVADGPYHISTTFVLLADQVRLRR